MIRENHDNSVMCSLRELKRIEQDRLIDEERARQRAEQARLDAIARAERAEREAEAARIRAEEEAFREREREAAALEREQQYRLQEAESRARIAANALLEQQQLEHEIRLREQEIGKKRPTWLLALAAILMLGVGGLAFSIVQQKQDQEDKNQRAAEKQAELERESARYKQETARLEREMQVIREEARAAKTQAEQLAVKRKADAKLREIAKLKAAERRRKERDGKGKGNGKKTSKTSGKIEFSEKCLNNPLLEECL